MIAFLLVHFEYQLFEEISLGSKMAMDPTGTMLSLSTGWLFRVIDMPVSNQRAASSSKTETYSFVDL